MVVVVVVVGLRNSKANNRSKDSSNKRRRRNEAATSVAVYKAGGMAVVEAEAVVEVEAEEAVEVEAVVVVAVGAVVVVVAAVVVGVEVGDTDTCVSSQVPSHHHLLIGPRVRVRVLFALVGVCAPASRWCATARCAARRFRNTARLDAGVRACCVVCVNNNIDVRERKRLAVCSQRARRDWRHPLHTRKTYKHNGH